MSDDIFLVTNGAGLQYTQGHPGWLSGDELETARPLTADELMDHGYGILIKDVAPVHDPITQTLVRKPVSEWEHTERLVTVTYEIISKSVEEQRAEMPQLSARQLRLALLSIDLHEADIDMLLVNDAAGMIEWKYASFYKRTHPLIDQLGAAKGLLPEHVDSMWRWASEL